jgi:YesN/AraC family two-component response regulator
VHGSKTYLSVILISFFMLFLVYWRMIKPIRRQIAFMEDYTKDTGRRITVIEHNEIGEMAEKMNQMLDDIEHLNAKIMKAQKRKQKLDRENAAAIPHPSNVNYLSDNAMIHNIIDYIQNDYQKPISLQKLAEKNKLSESDLSTLIKKKTGNSSASMSRNTGFRRRRNFSAPQTKALPKSPQP